MAFLQASRMVAAAVAGGQPPTAQMAALAAEEAEAAATHAPQDMDIDGAPMQILHDLQCAVTFTS